MSQYFAAMFRRRPNDGWFRAGRYDATTVDILCTLAVATMFLWGLSRNAFNRLLYVPSLVSDLELWRAFTWPIATQPDFFPLLGIVFFWVFGQQLEALFGRNKFVVWVLATTLTPAVVLTLLEMLDGSLNFASFNFGLSTLFLGGIWVYAASYPGVRWFEVIPLWAIAAVFTVLNVLQFAGTGATGELFFLLIACGAALVAARSLGLATGWPIPHIPLSAGSGGRRSRPGKSRQRRSRDRVVEGPWQRGPAPQPPRVVATPADQAELDSLLDKIGASGMDSLSSSEKKRLNELSKRLRNS